MTRIIGGSARGRKLVTPPGLLTRPTSDRTREALFNTLAGYLELDGAAVLDLYAGTGAVGLEALSRGARQVVLVESDRRALEVIRRNVATVGLPGVVTVGRSAGGYLRDQPTLPFDLVFADPPYDTDPSGPLSTLLERGWTTVDTTLVIERDARSSSPFAGIDSLTPLREARYGDTVLWYGRPR